MKQYKVIRCSVDEMEDTLNNFAKDGWTAINISELAMGKLSAVLETFGDDAQKWQLSLQRQQQKVSRLLSELSTTMKEVNDVINEIVRKMGK